MGFADLKKRQQAGRAILLALKEKIGNSYQTMIQKLCIRYDKDPFVVLIACMLSARARDDTVLPVVIKLFDLYRTPISLLKADESVIESIIRPIGFYKQKVKYMFGICRQLISVYEGKVPSDRISLMKLPGVGGKTSALVLAEAFGVSAICVDTHVMRLSREFGLTNKSNPHDIEKDLEVIFPSYMWRDINNYFVIYGQRMCFVWSKKCHKCVDREFCFFLRSLII